MVTAEVSEVHEIVHNLMTNSIHWLSNMPSGQRAIQIQIQRAENGFVEIVHSDSGPGVDPAIREEIFLPYFSTRDEGVGLGLAVVGDIATDYYGGELELLDNGPLHGATFRVTLRRRV
jgi:C4-dicarboxylate-specific signal transduction histidine kinase